MPNWNANNMIVTGKGKDVKQFIVENFRTNKYNDNVFIYELDFEQFDPTPLDENGDIINDWYHWRLEHWGCKWSACNDQIISLSVESEGKDVIVYDLHTNKNDEVFSEELVKSLDEDTDMTLELRCYFDTPWGPPEGIFMQWYEKYKELDIEISLKFYEPGMVFAGEFWFSKDEYCSVVVDDTNTKEWIKYLLTEGWEDIDWFVDECSDWINEMEDEKVAEQVIPKMKEMLATANVEEAATLIADICDKYYDWLRNN